MRILDLCCGAGGAAMGYYRAFPNAEIVGVDIRPMPRYPFEFIQADAMTFPLDGFDLIHASLPCHDHANVTGRNRKSIGHKGTGWMLEATVEATVERLRSTNALWVVENVDTAKMPTAPDRFRLCGSMFGLDVRRHRWFASSVVVLTPACCHAAQAPRFRSLDSRRKEGSLASVVGVHGHLNYPGEFALRCAAMGIDWMTNDELSQAIPPAYTEYIGQQLAQRLDAAA